MEAPGKNLWTDHEHALYVQAIRMYGRDWNRVYEHMGGTKDIPAIRNRTTNVVKAIKRNPYVDYADLLPVLDLSLQK